MVKSVDRITRILNMVGEAKDGLTNSDLARTLDLPKSTLSKLLASLTAHEWLVLDKVTKRYTLGPLLLFLGSRYIDHLEMVHLGRQFLRQLQVATSETVAMEVPSGNEVVMVARLDSSDAKITHEKLSGELQRLATLGQRAPMYATAAGKCILAYRTDLEINQYLESVPLVPITRNTVTDRESLWQDIRRIRSGSLACNNRELNSGTVAMAAPVFDFYMHVVAALAVITPDFRFDAKKKKLIGNALRRASMEFSRLLGYHGPSEFRG